MFLTLANFKQQIDSAILQRGRQYHFGGHVVELEEVDDGVWSALVEGTDPYNVDIAREEDGALSYECTCPYDLGPVCKHVVAVLYAIEESFPEYASATPKKPRKKRQTRDEKVLEILNGQSHEDLVALLLEAARNDRQLANLILARYGARGSDQKLYSRMVKDALNLGKGPYGFIDYRGSDRAAKGIRSILKHAEDFLLQGEPTQAIPILKAVIESTVPAIEHADDSNGGLSSCISLAFDFLDRAIAMLSPDGRGPLFAYCMAEALDEKYIGWDWGWNLAEVAAKMVHTPEQRNALFTTVDRMAADRRLHRNEIRANIYPGPKDIDFPDHDAEYADEIKLMVIERLDGPNAVEGFLKARVNLPRFRQTLVQFCIEQGNLAEAKRLCNEYVEIADSRLPGIQLQFQVLLLEIAQKENDITSVLQRARVLFLRTGEFAYYDLLKELTAADEWENSLQQLVRELKGKRSGHVLPEIYLREEKWDELLAAIQEGPPGAVDAYRKHLEPRFPAALCDIYERLALATLSAKANRQGYQLACQYLRRMSKLGQKERVDTLVRTLREKFRNRPALLDELKNL